MKINRLYTKIFLSFLGILIIAEALIFALFIHFAGRQFRERFEHHVRAQVGFAKELVEDKIRAEPQTPAAQNPSLKDLIQRMGGSYGARFWLTGPEGVPLVQSFEGAVPRDVEKQFPGGAETEMGPFTFYKEFRKDHRFYALIPIQLNGGQAGTLHAFFERLEPRPHKGGFAIGLGVIGGIIALLVVPVSRKITRPLNRLRKSALRISEGDLSHRASLTGRDEIGQLGEAFNRMAERLERMIQGGKELTAHVSHELRSPLARIRVAEEMVRSQMESRDLKKAEKYLDSIRGDIEELDRLIGRILEFSRLDMQGRPFERAQLDLSSLLHDMLGRFEATIGKKGLVLITDFPPNAPFFGDRMSLESALSNLLDNAVKFTPEGGEVSIRVSNDADGVRLGITNTCRRLSEDELNRLFEPFYRMEDVQQTGTGLGLAIVRKIVEGNGGHIDAANSDRGLQFEIRFPR
jgi:signal transduction histidine kinase